MIREHDCVVLLDNLVEDGLVSGDVGTVVHVHRGGEAFEVEFATYSGRTVAVTTVMAGQVRAVASSDLHHVRPFSGP